MLPWSQNEVLALFCDVRLSQLNWSSSAPLKLVSMTKIKFYLFRLQTDGQFLLLDHAKYFLKNILRLELFFLQHFLSPEIQISVNCFTLKCVYYS